MRGFATRLPVTKALYIINNSSLNLIFLIFLQLLNGPLTLSKAPLNPKSPQATFVALPQSAPC